MSALWLKLSALFIMLIDHTAVVFRWSGIIRSYTFYRVLRGVGRVAFPIFGFQLVQGAMHTKSKWKYLLRLFLLALISDHPFDLALRFTWLDLKYQNVFWTLFLGLIIVFLIQYVSRLDQVWKQIIGWVLTILSTLLLAWTAENVLHTDYGDAGVYMIAAMGLLAMPLTKLRTFLGSDRLLNVSAAAFGIGLCVLFTSPFEAFAFFGDNVQKFGTFDVFHF